MKSYHLINFLCFFVLIAKSFQENKVMNIKEKYEGQLEQDKYEFYTLTIPAEVKRGESNLIISIKGADCEDPSKCTSFSDPDLFISKIHENPKDEATSTYSGDSYGSDIVSISPNVVIGGHFFHIGVYCQYKCKYVLQANLESFLAITAGKSMHYTITKDSPLSLQFQAKDKFEELKMSFISMHLGGYKVYVSNQNPSTHNSIKVQPSWIGGYTVHILKDTPDYFPNQKYNILIEALDSDVTVSVTINYPETVIALTSNGGSLESVAQLKSRCYSYSMKDYKQNEKLILNLKLFSGSAILRIGGFKNISSLKYDQIPIDGDTYNVTSEKVIILENEDIEKMKMEGQSSEDFSFCIFGKTATSFYIRAYYNSQVESLQRFNMHIVGSNSFGYLPSGQVTKFKLIEFNKDSNLTINLDAIEGEPELFGYFSDIVGKKLFTTASLAEEITKGHIMEAEEIFSGFELFIPHANNKCHKDISQPIQYSSCSVYAVVSCLSDEDCVFRLRTTSHNEKQRLIPRTSLYNILPLNGSHFYSIELEDDNFTLLTVVLNAISGETMLKVNYTSPDKATNRYYVSNNKGYLPNVINITPERVKGTSIKGSYVFEVYAKSFSTYSIYYYTNSKDFNPDKPDWSGVTLKIENGQIIQEIFQSNVDYKIFSYVNTGTGIGANKKDSDIFITLTRRNSYCSFYVFLDLKDMIIQKTDRTFNINGTDWRSGWDNELIISKNDPKYLKQGTYYIVVARLMNHISSSIDGVESFNLGVTNEETDFILYDGVQHSVTLRDSYKKQTYWYTHESKEKDFFLSINCNHGYFNLYIDFKKITPERIINDKSSLFYLKNDQKTDYITIKSSDLKSRCMNKSDKCAISIYVEQKDPSISTQYLIIGKSGIQRTEYLSPGNIVPNTIMVKEKHHYIIEEWDKERQGSLYVNFKEGTGRVYMNTTNKIFINETDFPDETHYEQKGKIDYHGQLITLPKDTSNTPLSSRKFLITVIGESVSYSSSEIRYTILYSSLVQKLTLNIPIFDIITKGGLQYYQFYLNATAKNAYISMYNMKGDAQLFVKYGDEKPDLQHYNWLSLNPSHDFISFDIDDSFFSNNQLASIEGIYTILIYSFSNTTYNLFVTDNPQKIVPINSNQPGSCQCSFKNDKCHFKMDHFVSNYDKGQDVTVVFSTNFYYGIGNIYASLHAETNSNTIKEFPSSDKGKYQWSNVQKNQKNFLKIDIKKDDPKLNEESVILLTVECLEKSMFDINAAKLDNSTSHYLDAARENIFYLKKQDPTNPNKTKLLFYNYQEADINFEVYSYTGRGNISVYQKVSVYDQTTEKYKFDYNHIARFTLDSFGSYYNTISSYNKVMNKYITFEINAETNFGFSIKLNFDQELTMVRIGKLDSYAVSNQVFYGYFDLLKDYNDVVLNVRSDDPKVTLTVTTKNNFLSTDPSIAKDQKADLPSENHKDQSGTTNTLLSAVSLKIKQIGKPSLHKDQIVRVIFKVSIQSASFVMPKSNVISILISPQVSTSRRITAKPLSLYYGFQNGNNSDATIYEMTKLKKSDNVLIAELSLCGGDIEYRLTSEISYFNDKESQTIPIEKSIGNGKISLTAKNAINATYYLVVSGKMLPEYCEKNPDECIVEYSVYFYTTTIEEYEKQKLISSSNSLTSTDLGNGKVRLDLPQRRVKDRWSYNLDYSSLNFDVYVTNNIFYSLKMDSLCYLSKYQHNYNRTDYVYNSITNSMVLSGLDPKQYYYVTVKIMNPQTGEIYLLRSTTISFIQYKNTFPVWLIFVVIFALIGVSGLFVYYFRKYKITRELLKYEMNDVRNMGQLPKSEKELKQISDKQKNMKYTPLGDEPTQL